MNAHPDTVAQWRERAKEELRNAGWSAQAIQDCFEPHCDCEHMKAAGITSLDRDTVLENERLRAVIEDCARGNAWADIVEVEDILKAANLPVSEPD